MRIPTPCEAEESWEPWLLRLERTSETFNPARSHVDASFECESVLGRLLLLRLLVKTLELCSGSLDDLPRLAAEPQMQDALKLVSSVTIVEKIARATIKRHLPGSLEAGSSYAKRGDLECARWKYLAAAELANVIIDFEQDPRFAKRWGKPVTGAAPLAYVLLQEASEVCGLLGQHSEAAMFREAKDKDPRLATCRS